MADLLDYALTTVSDVKESLGLDAGNTSKDNLIKRKINQATGMIENYTHRHFKETTYTDEEYDAPSTNQLVLKQRPVISFTSISVRDSSLNESDWSTFDSEEYFLDNTAGVVESLTLLRGGFNRYRVTYKAGYEADNWPDSLPWDLREAATTLAAYLVNNGTAGTNVKRKNEGQRSIEYFESSGNSLFESLGIDETLDAYANVTVGG